MRAANRDNGGMALVFTDLPADSAEMQTLHGYAIYGPPLKAGGGPPPLPPRFELVRDAAFVEPLFEHPVSISWAAAPPAARRFGEPFPPNPLVAALALIPLVSAALVWVAGRLPL
jgi:hypothetical protein